MVRYELPVRLTHPSGQPHHDERPWPCVAELAAVGSWPGCRFAASPTPSPAALPLLGRMHHADCAHVAGGAEPHDGKARNWRLEGGIDRAAPARRPDLEAAGNDDGDCPHAGADDNLDVPVTWVPQMTVRLVTEK